MADAVITRARARADALLAAARAKTDKMATREQPTASPKTSRAIEDDIVQRERVTADRRLHRERAQHVTLLSEERQATDHDLSHERARADEALAMRDDFMGIVSHDLLTASSARYQTLRVRKAERHSLEEGKIAVSRRSSQMRRQSSGRTTSKEIGSTISRSQCCHGDIDQPARSARYVSAGHINMEGQVARMDERGDAVATAKTNNRGDNCHEGDRGDRPGCGNGRDDARGAARAQAAINDVVVQVHASGFVPTELAWPSTWTDRLERDRTPSILGHELAGVVTALGYGTTGLSVGQRVFGLTDWYRDGSLAEYAAVEARNLAPLPGDVDFTVGASLPISGLTAWQGLFEHGRIQAGQSVLVHGAAGAVGSMVTQLAREAGAYVIGTGRAADRHTALDFGAREFVDLDNDALESVGEVDLVLDVIGGDIGKRSAGLIRAGGTFVSIVGPPEARPADGLVVDFVVESSRAQLNEIVQRVRDGRLRTNIGNIATLDDAIAVLNPAARRKGKTIIRVRP